MIKLFFKVVLFLIILISASCQKDVLIERRTDIDSASKAVNIENVSIEYFRKNSNSKQLGKLTQLLSTTVNNKNQITVKALDKANLLLINTDNIKKITVGENTMYVFSIKLITPRSITFQNLTIDESKKGTKAFITTYTPTKEWLNQWRLKRAGKFDGTIRFKPILLDNYSLKKSAENTVSLVQQVCETFTVYAIVAHACSTGDMPGSCEWEGNETSMPAGNWTPYYTIESSQVTDCYDVITDSPSDDGGGGGGGGTTPIPPGDYDPCDGPITVSSVGNSVSVVEPTPCDQTDPNEPYPIPTGTITLEISRHTSITENPKMMCILNVLEGRDSQNTNIRQTLYDDLLNTFREGKVWNITYKLEPIPNDANGNIVLGKRRGPSTISATNNFEIIFNSTQVDIASPNIMKTIIHEAFHAYLAQKALHQWGSVDPIQWLSDTRDMDLKQLIHYIEITKNKTINDLGHDFMSVNIQKMVSVLKDAIDPNNASNVSIDAYKGIFFQGLEQTKFYKTEVTDKGLVNYYNTQSTFVTLIPTGC